MVSVIQCWQSKLSKKKVFVKPQLCKEFGVSEKTLNLLTELELIKPDWHYRHGLQVVELKAADRKALECAQNCVHNKHSLQFPFERFLMLRFIQMPLDLVKYDLESKNLIWTHKYDEKYFDRKYEIFLSRAPKDLRACLEEHRPPKNDKERELFDLLLDSCELRLAYEHPEWEEAFSFMADSHIKTVVDAALSTVGTYGDVSDMLHEVLGVNIPDKGLMVYQQLFHDMSFLTSADIKEYFRGVEPSRRAEIQAAHGVHIQEYKLQSGLQADIKTQEIVDVAMQQVARKVIELTSNINNVETSEIHNTLRAFNILSDRYVKVLDMAPDRRAEDVPSFFKKLELGPQKLSEARILPPAEFSDKVD